MDVDILVSGHTHQFKAYKYEDRLLVNPGARRGAYGSLRAEATELRAHGRGRAQMTAYVYELVGEEVKVDKVEYSKA